MDMLFDEEIGTAAYLALRVLFSKTAAEWLEFAETPLGKSAWDTDQYHGIPDDVYRSDDYQNVFTLVKNSSKRRPPETWHLATIAVFLMRVSDTNDTRATNKWKSYPVKGPWYSSQTWNFLVEYENTFSLRSV